MTIIDNYITRREQKFFNVAKAVAQTSSFHGTHVGCCIVYKNTVVSVAANCEKTHPLQVTYNKYRDFDPMKSAGKLHAEIHALSFLMNKNINWQKTSIFVYRETKEGKPVVSRPCKSCGQLIRDLGIPFVYYIDNNGKFVKEKWI